MTIELGQKIPNASLSRIGDDGPEQVDLGALLAGRRVVIFALPGAFTPTCHSAHLPGFIKAMDRLRAKGVDEVICISVNDPHVMKAWGEATGATTAGITLLADPDSAFTEAMGMRFDAPATGLLARSKRYALCADDGVITQWHPETGRGCEISGAETMLAAL